MSDSSHPQSNETPPPEMVDGWLTAVRKRLDDRKDMCEVIARSARDAGLDSDWTTVNRHYRWFCLWYYGGLATGHLIHRTGVKYKVISIEHWSK